MIVLSAFLFTACGKSKSGKDIAQEVCDCSKKANGMPATDPGRKKAQDDCMAAQQKAWDKVKGDPDKAKEFNDKLSECAKEYFNSFGK